MQNAYGGLHGGAVAALAEMVSIACARTVVGEDKDLFLGELSMSYLSAAPRNVSLLVFTFVGFDFGFYGWCVIGADVH